MEPQPRPLFFVSGASFLRCLTSTENDMAWAVADAGEASSALTPNTVAGASGASSTPRPITGSASCLPSTMPQVAQPPPDRAEVAALATGVAPAKDAAPSADVVTAKDATPAKKIRRRWVSEDLDIMAIK